MSEKYGTLTLITLRTTCSQGSPQLNQLHREVSASREQKKEGKKENN